MYNCYLHGWSSPTALCPSCFTFKTFSSDSTSIVLEKSNDLANENEQLKAKLESEENECLKLIDERDFREEQINRIADALGDFREWSNQNDRGENCIESIEILNAKLEKAKDALRFCSIENASKRESSFMAGQTLKEIEGEK